MQGINSLYYSTAMRPRMARGGITSIRQPYGFGSFVRKAVGKITKPVAKILDKVVPNEIKPALPYLAAVAPFIIPPQFAFASQGIFSNPAISRALLSGGLSLGSQMAQEGYDPDNPNLIGPLLSAASAYLATPGTAESIRGMQTIPSPGDTGLAGGELGILDQAKNLGLEGLAKTSDVLAGGTEKFATEGLKGIISKPFAQAAAIPLTTQTTSDAMAFAKQAQLDYEKQLAEYNQMLTDEGLAQEASDQGRAEAIYNSMVNAGAFTTDTIRETLDQLGLPSNFFAGGGRVKKAEGGLMNLRMGGMPAEIDARQAGGFIPIGKAEKADDVPARLSQNEFVMTADAVRGMGQGDINLGAQRMYNIMKQYEPIGKALV